MKVRLDDFMDDEVRGSTAVLMARSMPTGCFELVDTLKVHIASTASSHRQLGIAFPPPHPRQIPGWNHWKRSTEARSLCIRHESFPPSTQVMKELEGTHSKSSILHRYVLWNSSMLNQSWDNSSLMKPALQLSLSVNGYHRHGTKENHGCKVAGCLA
jgi:hypothetical protein